MSDKTPVLSGVFSLFALNFEEFGKLRNFL